MRFIVAVIITILLGCNSPDNSPSKPEPTSQPINKVESKKATPEHPKNCSECEHPQPENCFNCGKATVKRIHYGMIPDEDKDTVEYGCLVWEWSYHCVNCDTPSTGYPRRDLQLHLESLKKIEKAYEHLLHEKN